MGYLKSREEKLGVIARASDGRVRFSADLGKRGKKTSLAPHRQADTDMWELDLHHDVPARRFPAASPLNSSRGGCIDVRQGFVLSIS